MKEMDINRNSWGLLSEDHYKHFKQALTDGSHRFNRIIEKELGDISGKRLIHLQCNTGADTILLAGKCAHATGVDFVPGNVFYATKLAEDLHIDNVDFMEANIMSLADTHHEKYDMVFTSEGAVGWLPDLKRWGQTIRHLLKDNGCFYVFDSHPFYLMMDQEKFARQELSIKYPYFDKTPDEDDTIGGYASDPHPGTAYFWMYTIADIINALAEAGLRIEFFHEFEECFYDLGGMRHGDDGLYYYDFNHAKFPLTFSLKATVNESF